MRLQTLWLTAVLTLTGVMAAMAYTQATVNSAAAAAVVATDDALLALSCSEGPVNADGVCDLEDGQLRLDFSRGIGPSGFQPNSVYEFADLVIVTNNSAGDAEVSVAADGALFTTPGLTADVVIDPAAPSILPGNGGTAAISFTFSVDGSVDLGGLDGAVRVTAVRGGEAGE